MSTIRTPYGIIYRITNLKNGKVYIGKTIQTLKRRWSQHIADSTRGKQTFLCLAIKKYKALNFKIEQIHDCKNKKDLNESEQNFIRKYKSNAMNYSNPSYGYNMTDGGETFRILRGEEHPQFTPIDFVDLKDLINLGYTIEEISDEFKVGHTVIENRVNDLGFGNISEARKELEGLENWNKKRRDRMRISAIGKIISKETKDIWRKQRSGSNNPRYIKIEREYLIEAIKKIGRTTKRNFTLIDAANFLGISKNTAMRKFYQILDMSFPDAKEKFFFEPEIKDLIKNGKNIKEISKVLGFGKNWVNKKIRSLWNISFKEASRLFRIYPKYDKELFESLNSEGFSFRDIEKNFIVKMILNHPISELTEILEIGHDKIYSILKNVTGFQKLTNARKFFRNMKTL
ncbi:MAG: GIY-YIG nuclease family protein [Candidatus Hermodarchaeota archaeon]